MAELRIEALRSLDEIAVHRTAIDTLDLASRRPCPFATFAYLETFLAHDEFEREGDRLLFCAAFDGDRLVGYLPLCRRRERILGLPYDKLTLAITHDTDRPHLVARAEDEARCAAAFYRFLLERERGWSFLELPFQDEASALSTLPPLDRWRFHARRFPTMPNSTLSLAFSDLRAYFASVSKSERKTDARWSRETLAAGHVEIVFSDAPRAREPLLDLYLDLERRSWKEEAHAGVRRDARRVDFFHALCRDDQPMRLGVDLVLLDELPIAGYVTGIYDGGMYGLETCFDQAFEDLGAGHLGSLMLIHRGIESRLRAINFDGNYAYYKARMGAVVTETSAVQIYRVGSLPWLQARLGELKRRFFPPPPEGEFNPARRSVSKDAEATTPKDRRAALAAHRPSRDEERALARETLRRLEREGVPLVRLSGSALERALPFPSTRKAAA